MFKTSGSKSSLKSKRIVLEPSIVLIIYDSWFGLLKGCFHYSRIRFMEVLETFLKYAIILEATDANWIFGVFEAHWFSYSAFKSKCITEVPHIAIIKASVKISISKTLYIIRF